MRYVLTIAGSDSCGGAGIQADIKTIAGLGAHPLTAITAVTAQDSQGVKGIHKIPAKFISEQIEAVINDIRPDAVKIGMLLAGATVKTVTKVLIKKNINNVVIDPVMKATTGKNLLDPKVIDLFKKALLPIADVVTPNIDEASILAGMPVRNTLEMEEAARIINKSGPKVVVTGGHLEDRKCVDIFFDGSRIYRYENDRIETEHSHGSGCVFSSALACFLSMNHGVKEATRLSHEYTHASITEGYKCGKGAGAVRPVVNFID